MLQLDRDVPLAVSDNGDLRSSFIAATTRERTCMHIHKEEDSRRHKQWNATIALYAVGIHVHLALWVCVRMSYVVYILCHTHQEGVVTQKVCWSVMLPGLITMRDGEQQIESCPK